MPRRKSFSSAARSRLRVELLENRLLLHGDTGRESHAVEHVDLQGDMPAETHSHEDAHAAMTAQTHQHMHGEFVEADAASPPELSLSASPGQSGVLIYFEITHFDLSEEAVDGPHVDGQGHLHLYVDGVKVSRVFGEPFELTDLSPGSHVISADVNSNDHRAYALDGEKIEASIEIYSMDFIGPIAASAARLSFGSPASVTITGLDAGDFAATSVHTAGDFNGDGIDDFLVSAPGGDQGTALDSGEAYVVYGSAEGLPSSLDLSTLTGLNGFKLIGEMAGDLAGTSVSGGGDVNGDGRADIVIGAAGAGPNGRNDSGAAYVVFGANDFGAAFNLANLNGANGFQIEGAAAGDEAGRSVAIAKDVNGDGLDDVVVGAPFHDSGGSDAGAAFVLFGSTNPFPGVIDLASVPPQNGFRIDGSDPGENLGYSVDAAGDVNGDMIGDLLLGAPTGYGGGVATSCDASNTVGLIQCEPGAASGYTLFAPNPSQNTYLVDQNGFVVNSWTANNRPGFAAELLPDGSLLRAANNGGPNFNAGGRGGQVEIYDWDGNRTWQFTYNNAQHRLHHDIEMLPNGNVLMIAWELKTSAEAIQAGRDPSTLDDGRLWPDHIIEVQPTGPTSGEIVWQWNAWDHLVQDYDATKDNFGSVSDNPQLIDINFMRNGGEDWLHINSIDYNADLDQILLSVHGFSEIWVIDHSTTTAEAASHSGGNSGKGGDILYRWGNPQAYDRGAGPDRELFTNHDAQWIKPGLPGAGNILIFNNGQARPGGNASSVEEITPPVDASGNYALAAGDDYGPETTVWTWMDNPAGDFYAQNLSGAHRLSNGNTFITEGPAGRFLEIDASGNEVFEYVNPVRNTGPVAQGTTIAQNAVFRAIKYEPTYVGLAGRDLTPGGTVETGGSTSSVESVGEGSAYVVFGDGEIGSQSVAALDGDSGFKISGVDVGDRLGYSVSGAGDVNGDGFSDVVAGAPYARVDGVTIGAAYVVLGKENGFAAEVHADSLDGGNGHRLAADYQSDPILDSLFVNEEGVTGYNGAVVNFDSVLVDGDYVHIHTSGIPHYDTIGPWERNPNDATDQDATFYLPRDPQVNANAKSPTGLGAIGTWIDGTAIFNWSDGRSYQDQGNWNQVAVVFEGISFDACDAHPPGFGQYHTHGVPTCLVNELDDDGSGHSPILGWSFDGFPIYGPYGFVDGDPGAGIERMESSWHLRNLTTRVNGPALAQQALGSYREDYEHVAGSGDLDQYNGRFGPTPEYPDGIYHYHVTIDSAGEPAFPFVIGLEYNGVVAPGNTRNGGQAPTLGPASISVGSAGDVNDDGFDDVVVGTPTTYVGGVGVAGSATVVHGHNGPMPGNLDLHMIDPANGQTIDGASKGDQVGSSVAGAGDVNGDGASDLLVGAVGSDSGGSGSGEATIVFGTPEATPPTVEWVQINGGSVDRSSVTELIVQFDRPVAAPAEAFVITHRESNAALGNLVVNSSLIDGKTRSVVTFGVDPSTVELADGTITLTDGNYRLDVVGAMVTDAGSGAAMAADHSFGGEASDAFFRYFGDVDGDRDVDGLDYSQFGRTFLRSASHPDYHRSLDSDGDGDVDGLDYGVFSQKFLRSLGF